MAKKIFELAKELEMKPLDLVEYLKGKGFNVRNHMASLADEEVEEILALRKSEEEEKAQTSGAKKKVAKKAVKKKTAKTTKKAEDGKKKAVRRKTVIRKKSSDLDREDTDVEGDTDFQSEEQLVASPEIAPESIGEEEAATGGLRVVSVPKPESQEETLDVKAQPEEKVLYKEKMHKFTPVYIPPQKEVAEEGGDFSKEEAGDDEAYLSDKDSDGASKKRLGGLASMMSSKTKVGVVNRAREISLTRAEEELKTYSTLSSYGKPIYSPVKRKKMYVGPTEKTELTELKESKRVLHLHGGAKAADIAQKLSIKFQDLADKVLDINLLVKPDDFIGIELAEQIASLYEFRVENRAFDESKILGVEELSEKQKNDQPLRNPILTIMGHVDHGKTTLLDYIRNSKVAASEAGGITQHIGAYSVRVKDRTLTFLDTPGHEAFGAIRQRGANITDLVILVVAADDGVMPQTKESIRFCKQAEVPIIVAINKMDKEGVNPERIKQELTEFEITPEEWGGDTQFVPISALKGEGIDDLLEAVALQTEMMELRADPKGKAEGVVIECKIEQGRGPVATVLVQKGTLKKGDSIVVGEACGRARSMTDDMGNLVNEAGPSMPVQILGLDEVPNPGDVLNVVKNEREAKKIVTNRTAERKALEAMPVKKKMSLEDFFAQSDASEQKKLNLIVRTDVLGSYEAIKQSLEALNNKEVNIQIIGGGVGAITDNDVNLASSATAVIIGFNMRPVTTARRLAEQQGVEVKTYSIIYELINDVKLALEGLLAPDFKEVFIGRAEVRETFIVPKIGVIAGSMVIDGNIKVGCNIRLLRSGKIVFDGKMSSLKRFKDDVKEVKNGYECGIGLENFNDIKVSDVFEAYMVEEHKRTLEDIRLEEQKQQEASPAQA